MENLIFSLNATVPIFLTMVLGVVFKKRGLFWSLLRLPTPKIMVSTLDNVSKLATPLGLMAMGAGFDLKSAVSDIKPVMLAVFMKLVGFAAIFIPIALVMGFRDTHLASLLIMLGSPTTVTCFVMAKSMGHDGNFTSSAVMLTTLLCGFTLTGWLWLLKTMGAI